MTNTIWIDFIPLYIVFLLSVALTLLAIFVGMRLYNLSEKKNSDKIKEQIGTVVGATLALLAFVLAFTFNMAASRFDARKQLLLSEVNAINSAYLQTGLLSQPYQSESRKLLQEYVDLRIRAVTQKGVLEHALKQSEVIQHQLWTLAARMITESKYTPVQTLYIRSLNKIIELHNKRVTVGLQTRIPSTIWVGLYIVATLAMLTVGYQFGQSRRFPGIISIVLAMAFSSVLTLIADLDRSVTATVRVNQAPLIELQKRLVESS